jgi:PAS domain S-box-containing protein
LRTLPTASAILDAQLRLVEANPRWLQCFGLEGDIEGRLLHDLVPDLPPAWKHALELALGGESVNQSTSEWRRDGRIQQLNWTIVPWHGQDGALAGVAVHVEDVTERERMRHQLQEQRDFTRALFTGSQIGMNLCSMDGLWLESNPAFLDIIGYSPEEADGGLTYWELTPDEYSESEAVQLQALQDTGRYGPYEKEFIRKDGSRVPVRLNGFLIEREGQQYIWSLIEDMTEQRRLQQTIESQRLQALQAAKLASLGEFAAGIAHEINNPLQIIDGFAFAASKTLDKNPEKAREHVEGIRVAADRAARIVRGLLRFAREGDSKQELVLGRELAAESLSYTAERMRIHGVKLLDELESDARVRCNPLEITQVLVNLLNNAFDAVRDRGGSVRLQLFERDDRLVFDIVDDGPGVPPELEGRLFEPFTTSKQHGTGLGLSISQGIVESSGGSLRYHRADALSHFTVELPLPSS